MITHIFTAALVSNSVSAKSAAPAITPSASVVPKPAPEPPADPQFTLPVGTAITVLDFDAKTNTFLLSLNDQPAVGPNYASPEALHRAIGFAGNFDDFKRQRAQMIGSLYQLARPCPLVTEGEMTRRNKKAHSGERAW